jgi:phage FluMu protein Com
MAMSRESFAQTDKRRHRATVDPKSIGLCRRCGCRLTLCGKSFSADIKCDKCFAINIFKESQQPVAIRDVDGKEIM